MKKIKLDKNWEFYRGTLGDIWEVWRDEKYNDIFNVPWEKVSLPHCFNDQDAVDPDIKYYQGPGWYRQKLEVNNPFPEGRTLLSFEGAGQKTTAYLYTQQVGKHTGGYDKFKIDITEAVNRYQEEENREKNQIPLCIRCDNSRDVNYIPSDVNDFNLYGGLYRDVNLVYLPAVSVDNIEVNCAEVNKKSAEIEIRADLYNPEDRDVKLDLEVTIIDHEGRKIAKENLRIKNWQGKQKIAFFNIKKPELWSPENPQLYRCSIKMNQSFSDIVFVEKFGVRKINFVKNGPFQLNGEKYYLKGTHRHEDHAGVGAAMTEEMINKELQMMKEMGVNFIRLGHYQQSDKVLALCDELGFIVWEEIPWSRGGLGGSKHRNHIKKMLRNMIDQHRNHPSVVFWGLGNECNFRVGDFKKHDKNEIREFLKELNEIAHDRDPDRYTALRFCDECSDIVDVYTPSIWAGWYHGVYTTYEDKVTELAKNHERFLHIEWGGDDLAGRHLENAYNGLDDDQNNYPIPARHGDNSETYFCELVEWILHCQEKLDWLSGTAHWAFKDFCSPTRTESPIPYINLKGVVERDLTKKESYFVFQSYWSQEPMAHIYGHTMPVRWGAEDEEKTVKVYSNCHRAELFLNGKSCGVKKRDSNDFPAAGLRWQVKFISGNNHLKVIAKKDDYSVEDEISFYYQTDKWGKPDRLRLEKSIEGERVYIEVKAYDENEVFCPDADFFVEFGITGDGKLIDNKGTRNGSRRIQLASGRAGIFVETNQGKSVISCSAKGLETVFIEV